MRCDLCLNDVPDDEIAQQTADTVVCAVCLTRALNRVRADVRPDHLVAAAPPDDDEADGEDTPLHDGGADPRGRMADPAYTPTIEEALADPEGFVLGMTEERSEHHAPDLGGEGGVS